MKTRKMCCPLKNIVWWGVLAGVFSLSAHATHIVGGEISLQHETGKYHRLTLFLYIDMIGANPLAIDRFVKLGFFSKKDNRLIDSVTMERTDENTIINEATVCKALGIQTKILSYQKLLYLEKPEYTSPEGFYVTYERCCRNASIVNIENPLDAGAAFVTEFPPLSITNHSPIFKPIEKNGYACIDKPTAFNFSATDADGDSLVYQLSVPYNGSKNNINPAGVPKSGPYAQVTFIKNISLENMIFGNPTLSIHPITGVLSLTGTVPGLYVFGVDVLEHRKGKLIGKVHREYQLAVIRCGMENNKPILMLREPEKKFLYKPKDTLYIDSRFEQCIDIVGMDTTVGQKLTLLPFEKVGLMYLKTITVNPNLKITLNNTDTLKAKYCVQPCSMYPRANSTVLLVLKNENYCSDPKYDSVIIKLRDNAPRHIAPKINTSLADFTSATFPFDTLRYTITGIGTPGNYIKAWIEKSYSQDLETSQSGISEVSWPATFMGTCDHIAKGATTYKIYVSDSVCGKKITHFETLRHYVKDSAMYTVPLVPNVCTPNGDGINDMLEVKNIPRSVFCPQFDVDTELEVFNRWGSRVFYEKSANPNWIPSQVSDGIYYVVVTYGSQKMKQRSWLQVIR